MKLAAYKPPPRLFAGLYGTAGTGKTHTAVDLAMATRAAFGLSGPIAMFDTEGGSRWHFDRVKQVTGLDLLTAPPNEDGSRMRALSDLKDFLAAALKSKASVVIIDQLSHVIEDCRNSYFDANNINEPEASQYGPADKPFTRLMKRLVDSTINVICCAREKQVYGMYKNSKGRMVTGPVGVKFGAKDSAYDFDLLVRMQSIPQKGQADQRVMSIEKDRSRTVHGQDFPYPYHVSKVLGGFLESIKSGGTSEVKDDG